MHKNSIGVFPSIMCADLCNLEKSIREIEKEGFDTIHVDLIDGSFSPSMPLGIDTIKQLRKITDLNFDVHIMAQNNEFFIQEMLKIGVQQISFHLETSLHTDRYIQMIRQKGVKVGIALNPATSLSDLEYVLSQCDTVLLMLINPGFATDKNETQVPYATKKVADLSQWIQQHELNTHIEVDGRVSLKTIPELVNAGANFLVAGSTSLFDPKYCLAENKQRVEKAIQKGQVKRGE